MVNHYGLVVHHKRFLVYHKSLVVNQKLAFSPFFDRKCKKMEKYGYKLPYRKDNTNDIIYYNDQIYIPKVPSIMNMILHEVHDSIIGGHVGMNKTLELVQRKYYWPKMYKYISTYINSCHKCQSNKSSNQSTSGLLQPLPIPAERWEQITIDFIGPLPLTKNNHNFTLVVVDKLSKMAHYIPFQNSVIYIKLSFL